MQETLLYMGQGELMKVAAEKMGISYRTIDKHRQQVLYFYGAQSTTQAVVKALKSGHLRLEQL
jgi:DNA-binding NarL/FixJ family response regulator